GGSCLEDSRSYSQTMEIIKNYYGKSKVIIVASAMKNITDKLIDFYNRSCSEDTECEIILNKINSIHRELIDQLIDPKTPEYGKSLNFLKKNIEELTQLGHIIQLIRPSADAYDLFVSYGEKLSTFILSQYLTSHRILSKYIPSNEIIVTDDNFGNAMPLLGDTEDLIDEKLIPLLKSEHDLVLCITGFFGSTKYDKKITTLGRGGTDLTAALVAFSLRNSYNCKVIYWKDVKGIL
ncbi:MAG: amino acid kinase family protein, partial [Promethearchaeota archaeon]